MKSVRSSDPIFTRVEDDNHTYPTLVGHHIREMTGSQRKRLIERNMSLEERVSRIEAILRNEGKL